MPVCRMPSIGIDVGGTYYNYSLAYFLTGPH